MTGLLKGKSLLVAGGGGIGGELARRFAREGALVTLGDVDLASARAVVAEIIAAGGEASAVELDGSDERSIVAAVAHSRSAYGGLDGLHANFASFADSGDSNTVLDLPLAAYDETMRVNVRGFLLCTRHALPALIARGGGTILYTSSASAYRGVKSRVAYAMSKAAGHALMRHVAATFGKDGVRANTIAPGSVIHERLESELTKEFKDWMLGNAVIKSRLGRPADIAAMSALLMSDEGSYVTGQVINVDGGLTMRA